MRKKFAKLFLTSSRSLREEKDLFVDRDGKQVDSSGDKALMHGLAAEANGCHRTSNEVQ